MNWKYYWAANDFHKQLSPNFNTRLIMSGNNGNLASREKKIIPKNST